jgi:hypothetical protein
MATLMLRHMGNHIDNPNAIANKVKFKIYPYSTPFS